MRRQLNIRGFKMGKLSILIIVALMGCAASPGKSSLSIDDDSLKSQYSHLINCIHWHYHVELEKSNSGAVRDRVSKAADKCQGIITEHGESLAERALVDNGWGKYTQPVVRDTIVEVRSDIIDKMTNYYEGNQ